MKKGKESKPIRTEAAGLKRAKGVAMQKPATKLQAGTPARIDWEEAVLGEIVASGICQSDAQSVIEADETLLDTLFHDGTPPVQAADRFLR